MRISAIRRTCERMRSRTRRLNPHARGVLIRLDAKFGLRQGCAPLRTPNTPSATAVFTATTVQEPDHRVWTRTDDTLSADTPFRHRGHSPIAIQRFHARRRPEACYAHNTQPTGPPQKGADSRAPTAAVRDGRRSASPMSAVWRELRVDKSITRPISSASALSGGKL